MWSLLVLCITFVESIGQSEGGGKIYLFICNVHINIILNNNNNGFTLNQLLRCKI